MSAKHTPGPWLVHDDEDVWSERLDGAPDVPLLRADRGYRRWGREIGHAERAANARVAAAAPEMLDAISAAEAYLTIAEPTVLAAIHQEALKKLRAALSKARGETP